MIDPICAQKEREVVLETERFVALARNILTRSFSLPTILFDLRGTTAGMFKTDGRQCWIRYNPWIFAKYYALNLQDTVPHEVAHYVVHEMAGKRRVKPHGREWQMLMEAFGADPAVTFNLDLEGIPQRRQKTHSYRCECRAHQVSTTRHKRVLAGKGRYLCVNCDGPLVFDGA